MQQIAQQFTKALTNNIERTFTYSFAVNTGYRHIRANEYDPIEFFIMRAEVQPFETFMELERYGYKAAKRDLDKYGIPYTPEQERRARILFDTTTMMQRLKTDVVPLGYLEDYSIEDLDGTGVVKLSNGYTTSKTIALHERLNDLPINKETDNVLFKNALPANIQSESDQLEAIQNCLTYHVSSLVGGAGTGKSYVTAQIIDQLIKNDKKVVVLAPTHKAKDALQEKLANIGPQVKTIHSFIYSDRDKNCDAIIIDEAGMLSTPLTNSLLADCHDQQLIFVGDKNQLEPVDYGRPFEKIIQRFKSSELTKNRRSESADIVTLGKAVIDEPINENTLFENVVEVDSVEEAFEEGAEVVLTYRNRDVQSVNEMKRIKDGEPSVSRKYAIGDIVIAKTNQDKFYNGQIFEITGFDTLTSQKGKEIRIDNWMELDYNFDLAYGLTIHKSQGSEWETVAYMPSELDTRNLAYVAITRAKKKLIIIGGLQGNFREDKEWQQLN